MSSGIPLLFGSSGPTPTPPATLLADLLGEVYDVAPGYTADLPGSLIDDVSGTSVGALACIDQARVEAVNNVTPYGANAYVLYQMSQQFGLAQGTPTNGNVYVVFSGSAGYVIPPGFIVSDGVNQYAVQNGGTIGSGGSSQQLYAVATNSNVFAIPAGAVDQVVTSVPSGYTVTVTNPEAGTPAQAAESISSYRSRLLDAYQVAIAGSLTYLKTLLLAVPGVSPRLVSVIQSGSNWEVICGGGDSYQVAGAIYSGVSNIGYLTGSTVSSERNVSATIYDAPNSYDVIFVNPPSVTVTLAVTWNTTLSSFTSGAAVDQYIIAAMLSYVNGITVGQPMNLLMMNELIQEAVASVLAPENLTTLTYSVTMNSSVVEPTSGTWIIPPPDDESYLSMAATACTSTQG